MDAAAAVARGSAIVLAVGAHATAASLAYLHTWHARAAGGACPPPPPPARAAAAALFLASKAFGTAPLRAADVVNVVSAVTATDDPWRQAVDATRVLVGARPADGGLPPPPIVGRAYAAAKRALLADEQALLDALQYELLPSPPPPHARVLNLCRLLRTPPALARAAAVLANDACVVLPAGVPAGVAAAACVQAAAVLTGWEIEADARWAAAVAGDAAAVEAAAARLVSAVETAAACSG